MVVTSVRAQQEVGVNGPVVLPPSGAPSAAPDRSASPPPQASERADGSRTPETDDGQERDGPTRAMESRSLGKPNGLFSARPRVDETNKDDAPKAIEQGGGLASALDPRGNDLTRVIGALAAVVGLILLTRTLLARYAPRMFAGKGERPSGVVEILARYPLGIGGRGQQLVVLKFARRVLLLHQSGSVCRTLTEMTEPDEVAGLLSRLEAGAGERNSGKFRAALELFAAEHETAMARRSRQTYDRVGAALAADTEIIDLTRTQVRSMDMPGGRGGLVSRRAVR